MQGFFSALIIEVTPHIVFGMLGGLVGSVISSDIKRYGLRLSVLFIIVAVVTSAGMADYLSTTKGFTIWWDFTANVFLGMIVGATIDVIRIVSPRLIEKIVVDVGDSTVDIVRDVVIKKFELITGVRHDVNSDVPPSTDTDIKYDTNNVNTDTKEIK